MKNTDEIFSYTGGYLDGDGCFYTGIYIQKPKNIQIFESSIQVVSVKIEILNFFKSFYGGAIRMKPKKDRHKDSFCWTIKGYDALSVCYKIYNFVIDKYPQIILFMEYINSITSNYYQIVSKNIIERRCNIIKLMREEKHMNNLIDKESIDKLKDIKFTISPAPLDFPYLAGLIDSEGCFRIKKWKPKNRPNNVYNIALEIGNTKFPILPWLIARFGGSACFIPAKSNKKASALWTLSSNSLHAILPKIHPYLRGKKEVCGKLMEFHNTILPNGGDRHSELFHELFEKRIKVRESIINDVHILNKKGL